jgi:hypothetical protein
VLLEYSAYAAAAQYKGEEIKLITIYRFKEKKEMH